MLRAVLLLLPFAVFADTVTLQCNPPTMNEDGSEIPGTGDSSLAEFRFYESQVDGGPYVQVGTAPTCELALERDPGTWYYVATAVNVAGQESDYSNQAAKTVATSPAPPSGLTVAGGSIAYTLQQITDGLVLYPTAVVTARAECDPYIKITTANYPAGVNLIPKASVTFPPGVQARTLYAECSDES